MWRQCGMRVFVLSAWKNSKGEVLSGWWVSRENLMVKVMSYVSVN
jgi:hypothetical protein